MAKLLGLVMSVLKVVSVRASWGVWRGMQRKWVGGDLGGILRVDVDDCEMWLLVVMFGVSRWSVDES